MVKFTFTHQAPDNKRAYYKSGTGAIYCIQDATTFKKPALLFYSCTDAGEPLCLHFCDKTEFAEMVLPDSLTEALIHYANQNWGDRCPF